MVQIPVNNYENQIFKLNKLPVLLYAGQISDDPTWNFSSHKHDDLSEIIYISQGEGTFIINDRTYTAKKGDILIYNNGIIHEEHSNPSNPLKTYFCGIGNLEINGIPEGHIISPHLEPVIHAGEYLHKIETYISDIFEECYSQILGYELICQHLLVSLILMVHRIISTDEHTKMCQDPNSMGYKIKGYIDKNYTQNISLNEIANRLYISQHYLSHIFKSETGYSPINYMISRRIADAKKLLMTTDMTVQEISSNVGYENPNYFTMLFKKVTGVSPVKFKEMNRK